MARRFPLLEYAANPWLTPILTFSLLFAWIAASIAIFSSMCSSCPPRNSSKTPPPPPSPSNEESITKTSTSAPNISTFDQENDQDESITELEEQIHGPIAPTVLPVSASKRRLSVTFSSFKIPEGMNKIKTMKKERNGGESKGKGEESLWKKNIILGGKCRLPNAEETEGNTMDKSSSSPKSLPATSRNTSFATNRGEIV